MTVVNLQNITKMYDEKSVFNEFNLEVHKGEFLGITGKSGAGKTTLLNIIGLLEKPDEGDVVLFGNKNPNIDRKSGRMLLRNKISYLFQNYALIENESVESNLKISARFLKNKKEKQKLIQEALHRVGLDGYEKKKIFQLSGGEQQRVALARIMIKPTELILADEPTGSLDEYNREVVMDILNDYNLEGKTIIIVTHDEKVSQRCKRVIEI